MAGFTIDSWGTRGFRVLQAKVGKVLGHCLCAPSAAESNPRMAEIRAIFMALSCDPEGDLVVKMAHDFIVTKPWAAGLEQIADSLPYATFSAPCAYYGFSFRSECMAMRPKLWADSGVTEMLKGYLDRGENFEALPENWIYDRVKEVHAYALQQSKDLRDYEDRYPPHQEIRGYGIWPLLGLSRHQVIEDVYWRDTCSPRVYHELAKRFGLDCKIEDFMEEGE